jgi:uncharacterized protein (DUF1697 family)
VTMPSYVAFLRAINLGATRKFPMAELRSCLVEAGFTDVQTHIQTGNVRLTTPIRSRTKVERELERLFAARVGFDVPTIAYSPAELTALHAKAEAIDVTAQRRYLTLLRSEPDPELATEIDRWDEEREGARVVGRAVYWWLDHPSQAAKLSNARIERRLGVATTRDMNVIAKLVEKWCGGAG